MYLHPHLPGFTRTEPSFADFLLPDVAKSNILPIVPQTSLHSSLTYKGQYLHLFWRSAFRLPEPNPPVGIVSCGPWEINIPLQIALKCWLAGVRYKYPRFFTMDGIIWSTHFIPFHRASTWDLVIVAAVSASLIFHSLLVTFS